QDLKVLGESVRSEAGPLLGKGANPGAKREHLPLDLIRGLPRGGQRPGEIRIGQDGGHAALPGPTARPPSMSVHPLLARRSLLIPTVRQNAHSRANTPLRRLVLRPPGRTFSCTLMTWFPGGCRSARTWPASGGRDTCRPPLEDGRVARWKGLPPGTRPS